jgi:hypothetical protein
MTSEMVTVFDSAITAIKTDVITLIEIVIPVALILFGIIVAIRYGKRAFRTLSR